MITYLLYMSAKCTHLLLTCYDASWYMQTIPVGPKPGPNMSGLIWIQTVWHFDGILEISRRHCPLFNHCILSRSVYTCHLLALKFEADKDYFKYRHQRSCQLIFRAVGTPKKRFSKAILSGRSEATMSVTIFFFDVYTIFGRPFLLFFRMSKPIL